MEFGVLGGDARQRELAVWLQGKGYGVHTWGLGDEGTLADALACSHLILPLPVSKDGEKLHMAPEPISLINLFSRLRPGQILFGGQVTPMMEQAVQAHGAALIDYFRREELQIRNAVSTAEGAIQRAMENTNHTIHHADCLVIGYGRIGKILAHRLTGLGASVTVSARQGKDLAWIDAMGYQAVKSDDIPLETFQLIFNTVPALVLGETQLRRLRRDCLLIDLASAPGGVDRQAAQALGVHTVWALALPGQVAPQSAAEAIGETIFTILEELIQ